MLATAQVIVVGSYNLDLGVRVSELPHAGQTVLGSHYSESHGGKGSNQAINAQRALKVAGGVAIVACIGNDSAGVAARQLWENEGLNTDFVVQTSLAATGRALIQVDRHGENQITVVPGANEFLKPKNLDASATDLNAAKILLVQLEVPGPVVQRAFELAKQNKPNAITTVLNAAPMNTRLTAQLLPLTDILIINEHEANELAKPMGLQTQTIEALAIALRSLVSQCVVITLGKRGAIAIGPAKQLITVRAEPIEVVDSTGAGDAFVGTFCALWATQQHDFKALLKSAVTAGGNACRHSGAL